MEHREASQYTYTWLDDELSGKVKTIVEKHVNSCLLCQREIAYETELKFILKQSTLKQKAPPYLKAQIMNDIEPD